jgi:hypothetical protein
MRLRKLRNVEVEFMEVYDGPGLRTLITGCWFFRLVPLPASESRYLARLEGRMSGSRPMPRKCPHLTEWIPASRFDRLRKRQQRQPASLGTKEGKTYWWYKDEF